MWTNNLDSDEENDDNDSLLFSDSENDDDD